MKKGFFLHQPNTTSTSITANKSRSMKSKLRTQGDVLNVAETYHDTSTFSYLRQFLSPPLKYSARFREIFVRIGAKLDEKVLKASDLAEI